MTPQLMVRSVRRRAVKFATAMAVGGREMRAKHLPLLNIVLAPACGSLTAPDRDQAAPVQTDHLRYLPRLAEHPPSPYNTHSTQRLSSITSYTA